MFVYSKKDRNPSNTSKFIDAFFWWIFKFFFAFVRFIDKLLLLSFYTFNNIYNKPSKTICEHIRQMKRNLHIKIWTGKKFFFRSLVGTAQICFGQFFSTFFFKLMCEVSIIRTIDPNTYHMQITLRRELNKKK